MKMLIIVVVQILAEVPFHKWVVKELAAMMISMPGAALLLTPQYGNASLPSKGIVLIAMLLRVAHAVIPLLLFLKSKQWEILQFCHRLQLINQFVVELE